MVKHDNVRSTTTNTLDPIRKSSGEARHQKYFTEKYPGRKIPRKKNLKVYSSPRIKPSI